MSYLTDEIPTMGWVMFKDRVVSFEAFLFSQFLRLWMCTLLEEVTATRFGMSLSNFATVTRPGWIFWSKRNVKIGPVGMMTSFDVRDCFWVVSLQVLCMRFCIAELEICRYWVFLHFSRI